MAGSGLSVVGWGVVGLGWLVLTLVLVDELLAVAAWAVALLIFSVVVNALAQIPAIAALPSELERSRA